MIVAYYFRTRYYSVQYIQLRPLKWYHKVLLTQTNGEIVCLSGKWR